MAESKKNYYEILGVDKKATADEIKAAYRKLAKQYHPDLHPGDAAAAEKFKEINEANETLSDAQKRAAYDYELEHPGMGGLRRRRRNGAVESGRRYSERDDSFVYGRREGLQKNDFLHAERSLRNV